MNDYESIFILAPSIDEAESEKINQRMQEVITANGGEIVRVENGVSASSRTPSVSTRRASMSSCSSRAARPPSPS